MAAHVLVGLKDVHVARVVGPGEDGHHARRPVPLVGDPSLRPALPAGPLRPPKDRGEPQHGVTCIARGRAGIGGQLLVARGDPAQAQIGERVGCGEPGPCAGALQGPPLRGQLLHLQEKAQRVRIVLDGGEQREAAQVRDAGHRRIDAAARVDAAQRGLVEAVDVQHQIEALADRQEVGEHQELLGLLVAAAGEVEHADPPSGHGRGPGEAGREELAALERQGVGEGAAEDTHEVRGIVEDRVVALGVEAEVVAPAVHPGGRMRGIRRALEEGAAAHGVAEAQDGRSRPHREPVVRMERVDPGRALRLLGLRGLARRQVEEATAGQAEVEEAEALEDQAQEHEGQRRGQGAKRHGHRWTSRGTTHRRPIVPPHGRRAGRW